MLGGKMRAEQADQKVGSENSAWTYIASCILSWPELLDWDGNLTVKISLSVSFITN